MASITNTYLPVIDNFHVVLDFEVLTAGGILESGNCQVTFPIDPLVSQVNLKLDPA